MSELEKQSAAEAENAGFLDPRTKLLMQKFLVGGGAVGAGIGLSTSMANYLKYLSDKADKPESAKDDDVLYVNVPEDKLEKHANISKWPGVGSGLALSSGVVGLLVANALVNKMYGGFKKKRLQKDLDQAQQVYWNDHTVEKEAAADSRKPMSTLESISGIPVSLTLLAALASGVTSYKALNHYFPSRDPDEEPDYKPKEVKVRPMPIEPEAEEEGLPKEASAEQIETLARDLALMSLLDGMDKRASFLPDLVHAVAKGRLEEIKENFDLTDISSTLGLTKGASLHSDITPIEKWAAISLINRTPELSSAVGLLLAAEVEEELPFFSKSAAFLTEEDRDGVLKMAAAAYESMLPSLISEAQKAQAGMNQEGGEEAPKTKGKYKIISELMEGVKPDFDAENEKNDDMIDKALAAQ